MKKRVFACILALCLCVGLFVGLIAGCSHSENAPDPSKPQIVVTVFPIYDWMQNLLSDRAGEFGLTLLESSGADLHNYQPTVNDIYALSNCDLFVYIGGESDQWVADALTQAANKDMIVVNLMDALGALAREEELPEGLTEDEHGHEHDGPEYDEHIWLSVRNAAALCRVLTDALAKLDAANAEEYRENCEAYTAQLDMLDAGFTRVVNDAPTKTLLFADRYPFLYLVKDYGLTAYAAFSGCSAETEASFEMIRFLVGKVDELGLKHVIVLESGDQRIATTIISESRDKDAEILTLNSMQSVTMDDVKNGVSYFGLMQENLAVLEAALAN